MEVPETARQKTNSRIAAKNLPYLIVNDLPQKNPDQGVSNVERQVHLKAPC
jgi:hypothetical protein